MLEGTQVAIGGAGPTVIISDRGIVRPARATGELMLTCLHPGGTVEQSTAATGWPLAVAQDLARTTPRTEELRAFRALTSGEREPT